MSQKGITNHSYGSILVLKVVFHSSPSPILISWYPLFKSIFEKYFEPLKQSIKSSMQGNGNMYLMVILLISLESTHMHHPPSLFGMSNVGTTHELKLSFINPLSKSSCTYFFIFPFSRGVILYVILLGKLAPGINSIWWLILFIGGNAFGKSSTMILENQFLEDLAIIFKT